MGPTVLLAALGLVKSPFFPISLGRGFDQRDWPFAIFAAEIKLAVSAGERSFAHTLVAPYHFPGLELLAHPPLSIGVAVKVFTHSNHATVMVNHDLVRVNLAGVELAAGLDDLKQIAADAVT